MTAVGNQPSIAVMRRLGMHEAARFAHPRVRPGHVLRPHVLYRLTAAEHRRAQAGR
jgi:RimJ/RimL family protein N-acetyltransferase